MQKTQTCCKNALIIYDMALSGKYINNTANDVSSSGPYVFLSRIFEIMLQKNSNNFVAIVAV
jgi:hypothetical protein